MKKALCLIIAIGMILLFSACGTSNIEEFCDGKSISWDSYFNDKYIFDALFEDGTLTIERRVPTNINGNTLWIAEETTKYSYELQGTDTVIIDGETYTYEMYDDRVTFKPDLMGIASTWYK